MPASMSSFTRSAIAPPWLEWSGRVSRAVSTWSVLSRSSCERKNRKDGSAVARRVEVLVPVRGWAVRTNLFEVATACLDVALTVDLSVSLTALLIEAFDDKTIIDPQFI